MTATPQMRELGWKGMDAILPGTDGNEHQISDHNGPGGLVVVFICNHCPYVKARIGRIVRDAAELSGRGIGFVAVNSNDADAYPEDSFDEMKAFARRHALPFPYLHDEDQSLARTYGAVCTPDFFGFDADMKLRYRGRLDSSSGTGDPGDARRELFDAMVEISRTGRGPQQQVPSIGCSIKWKQPAG